MPRAKKPSGEPQESIIKPSIQFEGGKKHILEVMFDGENEDCPVLKSVGYAHIRNLPGQASFVSYVITSQGDKILNMEVEEPNMRYIAEESTKIAFVNAFMSGVDNA